MVFVLVHASLSQSGIKGGEDYQQLYEEFKTKYQELNAGLEGQKKNWQKAEFAQKLRADEEKQKFEDCKRKLDEVSVRALRLCL